MTLVNFPTNLKGSVKSINSSFSKRKSLHSHTILAGVGLFQWSQFALIEQLQCEHMLSPLFGSWDFVSSKCSNMNVIVKDLLEWTRQHVIFAKIHSLKTIGLNSLLFRKIPEKPCYIITHVTSYMGAPFCIAALLQHGGITKQHPIHASRFCHFDTRHQWQ